MSVTGAMKFLEKNYVDIDEDDASVACSTGTDYEEFLRNRNNLDRWISVGSSDIVTETIDLQFATSKSVNRLIIVKHNFKAFTAQYWNGATWVDFSSVVTHEGTQATITETANAKTTSYYEFAAVTTTKIRITITTTQTANAEKYAYQAIATTELGTFTGYPQWVPTFDKNQVENMSMNGRAKFSILNQSFSMSVSFDTYPTSADHSLIQTLWDAEEEFLIYPIGADSDQCRFNVPGYRLEDIYLVWFGGPWSPAYEQSVYQNALTYDFVLKEVA